MPITLILTLINWQEALSSYERYRVLFIIISLDDSFDIIKPMLLTIPVFYLAEKFLKPQSTLGLQACEELWYI